MQRWLNMSTKLPGKLSGAAWLEETLNRMESLPFNKDNWSDGAKKTDRKAVDRLVEVLAQILPDDAPAPAIVPTWLGGVQAEWHRNGIDLEISANPREPVEYYFSNGEYERAGYALDDRTNLKDYAKSIV